MGAGWPLRYSSLRGFMHRPSTMDAGSRLLGEPLSAAASQLLPPGGARIMGAPHSPLDPPKRLSHRPPSPVGGGTCAAAGDPVPEACSGLFLLVPWPQQLWAGLGSASAARRTFCERFAGPSVGGGTRVATGDPVPEARSDLFLSVPWLQQGCTQLPVLAPSPQSEGPPARGLQVSPEQKSPSLQYSVASGCRIRRELLPCSPM